MRTASLFIHMGPRQERIKTQFENLRVTLGLCGLGTAGSTWKTPVCHYFHYTFSRVPTWLIEWIVVSWGMGAKAQRGRIFGKLPVGNRKPCGP